jgi:hypothetical protein
LTQDKQVAFGIRLSKLICHGLYMGSGLGRRDTPSSPW